MFYTKKGDDGKTQIFGCNQKLSKSSKVAEALGALDEINSFLGIFRAKLANQSLISDLKKGQTLVYEKIILEIQNNLFVIQAEVAGADKKISNKEIKKMEELMIKIEKEIPPIKSFIISGSCEISAMFDFVRTVARRAERRTIAVNEENLIKIDKNTLIYLNRLSSLLYALARLSSTESGLKENSPKYS